MSQGIKQMASDNAITVAEKRDVYHLRKKCGLKEMMPKIRQCLKCSAIFQSEGVHHRICHPCRHRAIYK